MPCQMPSEPRLADSCTWIYWLVFEARARILAVRESGGDDHLQRQLAQRMHELDGKSQPVGMAVKRLLKSLKQARVRVVEIVVQIMRLGARRVLGRTRVVDDGQNLGFVERNRRTVVAVPLIWGSAGRRIRYRLQFAAVIDLCKAVVVSELVFRIQVAV